MNIALILSGGTGSRMESKVPKQYIEVNGKTVISYSVERLADHPEIDAIQIVADSLWHDTIRKTLAQSQTALLKFRGFSKPGQNRQLSIVHGLEDIRKYAEDSDTVLIHDAARPMLKERQITECLSAVKKHDGVLPVLPMKDTVYASEDGRTVSALLDRSRIYAGQAPEAFRIGSYYDANISLLPEKILKINGSTEPAVQAGLDIAMIPGDEENFKITTAADLQRFQGILSGI